MKIIYTQKIKLNFLFSFTILMFSLNVSSQTQQYLHFDRVDDFVEVPAASQYIAGSDAVTLTGWFYCDELGYGQGMFGFRNGGTGDGEMYMIQLNNGLLENRYITSAAFSEYVSPSFTVLPEVWQHYAWIYTGSEVQLYLDGDLVGSSPSSSGPITSMDTPFAIGQLISPFNFFFGGRIDEVTLWSKALSQEEIKDMIDNELVGDEDNLELYYKFNQGVPGEDNSSVTTLKSEVGDGERDGLLKNFTMNGEDSNFGGELDNSFQAISFPLIANKLITDDPFELEGAASSGLPVEYSIVSGPASVSGNVVSLDGTVGEVVVRATQPGDGVVDAAVEVENSFMVLDPNTLVPSSDPRTPLPGKEVWASSLGPIQLATISNIEFDDIFDVAKVEFEIDGNTVEATDWENNHYTAWWLPPAYGTYTMNIIATNNYGASSSTEVTFDVVEKMEDLSVNASQDVHLNINVGEAFVTAELPSYLGAFDNIMAHLDIDCPTGGCDPWDRISGVEVKGHNGEWYEIIRYITPYGIACNHSVDLTDFMSLLQGKVDFRFYLGTQGNGFLYTLNFDYGGGIPEYNYSKVEKLWNETLDFGDMSDLQPAKTRSASYPDNILASKVKLLATGHGWGDNNTSNAAEFSNNTHELKINGGETVFEHHNWLVCDPNPDGCNNQNGTWYFNRAGWCPGSIAPWYDYDVTDYIAQGDITLDYVLDENYVDFCNSNNPNCISGVTCDNCEDGFDPHLITQSFLINSGDVPVDTEALISDVNELSLVNFQVYPNPTDGFFTVEAADPILSLKVFNHIGQRVKTMNQSNSTQIVQVQLSEIHQGIYFVELRTESGTGTRKVVVE